MFRPGLQRGFTLVEVLIASTLAAVVMAAVLSSFVFLGRSLTRLANQQALEVKAREALTRLRHDFALARSVKAGTAPSSTTVTLVLPAGEVTYTYDGAASRLRRQADFGPNRDFYLLRNDFCACTAFTFDYFTTTGASAVSQITSGFNVPYSIKQIQVRFMIETPAGQATDTRVSHPVVSSRFLVRNKQPPTGS